MARVLIGCEYSGIVRDAFTRAGHDAWSLDILPTESKGNHIQGNLLDHLGDGWDLLVAHPPCTYLAVSGNRWLYNKDGSKNIERWSKRNQALDFVNAILSAPVARICLENPVSVISSEIRKPDQIIQPYYFGDSYKKTTCLWLKNLPLLEKSNEVDPGEFVYFISKKTGKKITQPKWYYDVLSKAKSGAERQKLRSKTFQGFAEAMADQWGRLL